MNSPFTVDPRSVVPAAEAHASADVLALHVHRQVKLVYGSVVLAGVRVFVAVALCTGSELLDPN